MTIAIKIATTTIKALLLLFVLNLTVSCSDNKNNTARVAATTQNTPVVENLDTNKQFNGGILKLLGTKLFNNPLLVNVNYNLKIKEKEKKQLSDSIKYLFQTPK